jgi:hypothetical protein
MTFREVIQQIQTTHWNINYHDFCRRAQAQEDDWSRGKWEAWQALNKALNEFDPKTLEAICANSGR